VMFVVLLVWATDIGAYAAGRAIGGPGLAPHISPGKTWSGATGGLLAAVAAGIFVAAIQGPARGLPTAAAIAAFLSIIGQAGDLMESLAKRRFGVKDSGHLIPGHGGALDRLDAMLAVLPAAWLLAQLAGHGLVMWR
jgi:phosphatidate cytidylyltransferase